MHKSPLTAFFLLAVLSAASLLLTSCQPTKPLVKIGINAELIGELPAVGISCKHAVELVANLSDYSLNS